MTRQGRRRLYLREGAPGFGAWRIKRRAVLVLIVGGLVAVAAGVIGWSVIRESGGGADPARAAPGQEAISLGSSQPDFAVALSSGEEFILSAFRGRVVVLEFLAPGCASCAEELAALSRVAEDFRERGVAVLVMDVGGLTRDKVAGYYRSLGGSDDLMYAPDVGLRVARQYAVQFLGTTVVLNGYGRETYRDGEGTREEQLAAAVRDAS